MASVRVATTLWAAAAAALLVACSTSQSATGDNNDGGASGDRDAAVVPGQAFDGSACLTCLKAGCADSYRACFTDGVCRQYLDCLGACPLSTNGDADAACEAACPASDSSNVVLLKRKFLQCRFEGAGASCSSCGHADGGAPDAGIVHPKNPIVDQICPASIASEKCAKCEEDLCCHTEAACVADASCPAVGACASACATSPTRDRCEKECYGKYPAASVTLHAARFACLQLYCATPSACGVAPLTTCVACTQSKCPNEFADCFGTPDCRVAASCANGCAGDSRCVDACLAAAPEAARKAFVDFNVCGQLSCPSECEKP